MYRQIPENSTNPSGRVENLEPILVARFSGLVAQRLQLGDCFQVARPSRGTFRRDQPFEVENPRPTPKKSNIDSVIEQI